VRGGIIDLAAAYKARVRLVYCEAPAAALFDRNADRPNPVPEAVLRRLLEKWRVPTELEAHALDVVLAA
jgi:predicted kinase